MSETIGRAGHLFTFTAAAIATAAATKANHHQMRLAFWQAEQVAAEATVRATASVDVRRVAVSGGEQVQVVVNYGDPGAYSRLQEAFGKWQQHRKDADRFAAEERVYRSQPFAREYQLTSADVAYFGFDGVESQP